jgi:hypothetical protein
VGDFVDRLSVFEQPPGEFPLICIHLSWASEANTAALGVGESAPVRPPNPARRRNRQGRLGDRAQPVGPLDLRPYSSLCALGRPVDIFADSSPILFSCCARACVISRLGVSGVENASLRPSKRCPHRGSLPNVRCAMRSFVTCPMTSSEASYPRN